MLFAFHHAAGFEGAESQRGEGLLQGAGSPAADLRTFHAQAEGAEQCVDSQFLHSQRGEGVTAEVFDGFVLASVLLQTGEREANLFDQRAFAAEVDRTLATAITVGEAVIRAVGLRAAAAPRGRNGSLRDEEFRPGGQEGQRGMGLLVTDFAIFQFLLLDQTTRFAGCLRSRGNGAPILMCAYCARCDGSCREQELGQRDFSEGKTTKRR